MEHLKISSSFFKGLCKEYGITTSYNSEMKKVTKQDQTVDQLMASGEFIKKETRQFKMNSRYYTQVLLYRKDGSHILVNHKGGTTGMVRQ